MKHWQNYTRIGKLLVCLLISGFSPFVRNAHGDSSAQTNLDSLLIGSVGGSQALDAINKLTSVKVVGIVYLDSLEGEFTSILVLPHKYYNELKFPGFTLTQGYSGSEAWIRGFNGQYSVLTGYERDELLKDIYFESFSFIKKGHADSCITYGQRIILDNIPYHQLSIVLNDFSDTVLVYLDEETGKRRMVLSDLDNAVTMTYIDDYRNVEGIDFPFKTNVLSPQAGLSIKVNVSEITLNQPFPDSLFTPVQNNQANYHFPDNQSKIIVPFTLENGHIVVEATVNGSYKVRFILDSGASTNIFDATLTRDAVLPIVGSLPGKGVSGFTSVDLVRVDSIDVAGVVLLEQVGGSFDLVSILPKNGDTLMYKGILGYDFLSRFPFLIDYNTRTLTLYNPKTFEAPSGGITIPFTLTLSIPTVHAQLNSISGDFLIDLGNARGVIVHPFYAQKNNLYATLKNRRTEDDRVGGVGGMLKSEMATVEHFQMGGLTVNDLEILLPETSNGVTGSEALAGNIGNEFLRKYAVLLDYSTNRLILYSSEPR